MNSRAREAVSLIKIVRTILRVRRMLRKWRDYFRKDSLVLPLQLSKKQTPEFKAFINGQSVNKSLHWQKRQILLQAIQSADMNHFIMRDPLLPELAVTLAERKQIRCDQLVSIIDRRVAEQEAKSFSIAYPILDKNQQLTQAARHYLIPYLSHVNGLQQLDNRTVLASFVKSVMTFPLSERIFIKQCLAMLIDLLGYLCRGML